MRAKSKSTLKGEFKDLRNLLLIVLLLPFLLVYIPVYLLLSFAFGLLLHLAVWIWWCTRGKYVLLVYSNSPVWQEYFESQLLPSLRSRAVVLNWSERAKWGKTSLAVLAFWYFGGGRREFNPLAVVFRPGRFRRVFRFWTPFLDFKHGNPQEVDRMTAELLNLVPPTRGPTPTATAKTGSV